MDSKPTRHQQAAQHHYLLKRLGSGLFATVYLCIRRDTADGVITRYQTGLQTKTERSNALRQLRESLQAIKIREQFGTAPGMDNLDNEVSHIMRLGEHPHPNMASLIECHKNPSVKLWYTISVYAGGCLQSLLNILLKPSKAESLKALAWHLCSQMTKAVLYLHHGILADGRTVKDWQPTAHCDIHSHNFLISQPAAGRQNPNIVLSDFGKAISTAAAPGSQERGDLLRRQHKDVQRLVEVMEALTHRVVDPELSAAVSELNKIGAPKAGAARHDHALQSLQAFVAKCEARLKKLKQRPLPSPVSAHLQSDVVTDAELEEAFPVLRLLTDSDREGHRRRLPRCEALCSCKMS